MRIRAINRSNLSNKVSSVMIRIRKMPIMNMTKQKIITSKGVHKIRRVNKIDLKKMLGEEIACEKKEQKK